MAELNQEQIYSNFVKFVEFDTKMKANMLSMAPPEDLYDERAALNYSDKLLEELKYIKRELNQILPSLDSKQISYDKYDLNEKYSFADVVNQMNKSISDLETKCIDCGLNIDKLTKFYKNNISNLSGDVVRSVDANIFGYGLYNDKASIDVLQKASSLNEILHILHTRISRDNFLYETLPVVKKTEHFFSDTGTRDAQFVSSQNCVVYGKNTKLSNDLAVTFQALGKAGDIQIVSINEDESIIMTRDVGHSLTLNIQRQDNGKFFVDCYFPKLINEEMERRVLPNIHYDPNKQYAVGSFAVEESLAPIIIAMKIDNLPNDSNFGTTIPFRGALNLLDNVPNEKLADVLEANPGLKERLNESVYEMLTERANKTVANDIPKTLYRGIKLTDKALQSFFFDKGIDMPPNFYIDKNGRKNVMDGQEYGIYLTDTKLFASMYGTDSRTLGSSKGSRIGNICLSEYREPIALPLIGLVYEIDTQNLDSIRRPILDKNLNNQQGMGEEYLSTRAVPSSNTKIIELKMGKDWCHDEKTFDAGNLFSARGAIQQEFVKRKNHLEQFDYDCSKLSSRDQLLSISPAHRNVFKAMYGDNGVVYTPNTPQQDIKKEVIRLLYKDCHGIPVRYLSNLSQMLNKEQTYNSIDECLKDCSGSFAKAVTKALEFEQESGREI